MEYKFGWQGNHISLNEWYRGEHWTKRYNTKKKWTVLFLEILQQYKPFKLERYCLTLEYNSRLDPSNTITMVKLFEDFLIKRDIIKDDSKKYCRGITITPRDDFDNKQYCITLKPQL